MNGKNLLITKNAHKELKLWCAKNKQSLGKTASIAIFKFIEEEKMRQAKSKKYHYTYKITNLINNKIYYGKHSTDNLEDKYFGSGLKLKKDIKKYGKDNFKFEIDKYFSSSEDAYKYEKEIVNEDFVNSDTTYNAMKGGIGGGCKNNDKPSKYKMLKMSEDAHDQLKTYCKQKGRTMKWVLENYIETECNTNNKGIRLKVDGSKEHV